MVTRIWRNNPTKIDVATQSPNEPLEEWADRCLDWADRAFKTLPYKYMAKQACMTFCQSFSEKEAGRHVANLRPESMEIAIDQMRLFLYNKKAIFGKGKKKVAVITGDDAQPGVHAVTNSDARSRPAIKSSPN